MTNKNTSNQNKNIAESDEYKALLSHCNIQKERIIELEDIIKEFWKTNPDTVFQKATDIQRNSNENATTTQRQQQVEFPADRLAKFFLAARNVKQRVRLTLNANAVVDGWVIE